MKYNVTITTLTPLHIGRVSDLLKLYDLKVDDKRNTTYRLNVDAILEDMLTRNNMRFDEHLLNTPPAELITLEEITNHPEFVFYTLDGIPQSREVKEHVKNVKGKLYIPGSSLKGCLRTIIGRNIAQSEYARDSLAIDPEEDSPQRADDWMEEVIFGPHEEQRNWMGHDLMRSMQVADSYPTDSPPMLVNVRVVKGNKHGSPVDLEAIPPQTTFRTNIKLDTYLCVDKVDELDWHEEQTKWLYNLPIAGRNVAREHIQREMAYFEHANLSRIAQVYGAWYGELKKMRGSNVFLMQMGWGAGWENKTYGKDLIARDSHEFAEIRNQFNMGSPPRARAWRARPDDIFPISRRLVVTPQGISVVPLGWVKVEIGS